MSFYCNFLSIKILVLCTIKRFNGAVGNPSPKILSVLSVVPLTTISMITMAATGSTSAKSVARLSLLGRLLPRRYDSCALTADTPSFPKRTASSSAYTNMSIPNALSISITSPTLIRNTSMRTMAKINISFITSTGNSPWISSA